MTEDERKALLAEWNRTSARLRSFGDTAVPCDDHEDPMPYSSREMRGNGPQHYRCPHER